MNALPHEALNGPAKRQADACRKPVMFFPERQENPAMFKYVQNPSQIPQRRENDRNLISDPGQFPEKSIGILDMLHGMRAKNSFKRAFFKRQLINRSDQDEMGYVRMGHNVRIDASAVGLAATDIEVPYLFPKDARLEYMIT